MMSGNMENHGFRFPGELTEVPMTLRMLAEWNRSINVVSAYAREMPDSEVHKYLQNVISMAGDFLCNICYDYSIDPFVLDYWEDGKSEDVIVTPFEPELSDNLCVTGGLNMIKQEAIEQLIVFAENDNFSLEIIRGCLKSFEEYHKAVFEHEIARRLMASTFGDAVEYRSRIESLDRARTACHNSMISNVRILNRMAENNGLPLIYDGVVSEEQPYRRELADAVFEYIEWLTKTRT